MINCKSLSLKVHHHNWINKTLMQNKRAHLLLVNHLESQEMVTPKNFQVNPKLLKKFLKREVENQSLNLISKIKKTLRKTS